MSNMFSFERRAVVGIIAAAGIAAAVAAPGCSFITNTTAVQCSSEAECLSLGPEFAGTTCDAQTRTCVKVASEQDLCKTNQECYDRAQGAPAICRQKDHKCVTLQTPECGRIIQQPGQLLNDRTIVIGAISPAGHTEIGDNMESALELAQRDFSTQVRGLPSNDSSTDVRPLVVLACREFGPDGFSALARAANHLAKDVQVPLVIGPVDPVNATITDSEVFNPAKILSVLPVDQLSSVASLPNPLAPTPIAWSTSYMDKNIVAASTQFVQNVLIPKVKETVTEPIRIAMIYEDNILGREVADMAQKTLTFNGKSAEENGTAIPPTFLKLNAGDLIDPEGNPAPEEKVAAAIGQLIGFKPHIIFHSYSPAAIAPIFFSVGFAWPQPPAFQPYHVDLGAAFGIFLPLFDIVDLLHMHGRVFSAQTHIEDKTRNNAWVLKYISAFPQFRDSPSPRGVAVQSWYDAAYMAAYAIVANGAKPLTGENLARTLPQMLPPGQVIQTGTEDMAKAFGLLQSGQGINLQGLTGNMDLDPRTGQPSYDMEITCPAKDANTGRTTGFVSSGFYVKGGVGQGTNNCPTYP